MWTPAAASVATLARRLARPSSAPPGRGHASSNSSSCSSSRNTTSAGRTAARRKQATAAERRRSSQFDAREDQPGDESTDTWQDKQYGMKYTASHDEGSKLGGESGGNSSSKRVPGQVGFGARPAGGSVTSSPRPLSGLGQKAQRPLLLGRASSTGGGSVGVLMREGLRGCSSPGALGRAAAGAAAKAAGKGAKAGRP